MINPNIINWKLVPKGLIYYTMALGTIYMEKQTSVIMTTAEKLLPAIMAIISIIIIAYPFIWLTGKAKMNKTLNECINYTIWYNEDKGKKTKEQKIDYYWCIALIISIIILLIASMMVIA